MLDTHPCQTLITFFFFFKESPGCNAKGMGNPDKRRDREILLPLFDIGEIRLGKSCPLRKLLLGHVAVTPLLADFVTDRDHVKI